MTDRNIIYAALHDAIDWNVGFIDSYRHIKNYKDLEEVVRAQRMIDGYKKVLKKYYRTTPIHPLDKAVEDGTAKLVNIYDLMKGKIDE